MSPIELACIVEGKSSVPKPPDLRAVRREAREMPHARLLRHVLSRRNLLEKRASAFRGEVSSKEDALRQRADFSSTALRELGVEPIPESKIPPELGTAVPVGLLEASSGLRFGVESGIICPRCNQENMGIALSRMIGISKLRAKTVFGEVFAPETEKICSLPPLPRIDREVPTFTVRMIPGLILSTAASVAVSLIQEDEGIFYPAFALLSTLALSALAVSARIWWERKVMTAALQFFAVHSAALDNMERVANSEFSILSEVHGNIETLLESLRGGCPPGTVKPRTLH